MGWVTYRNEDGYVIAVEANKPEAVAEGYSTAEIENYSPGDEVEYFIRVLEVSKERVVSASAVRQGPQVQDILRRIAALEAKLGAKADV